MHNCATVPQGYEAPQNIKTLGFCYRTLLESRVFAPCSRVQDKYQNLEYTLYFAPINLVLNLVLECVYTQCVVEETYWRHTTQYTAVVNLVDLQRDIDTAVQCITTRVLNLVHPRTPWSMVLFFFVNNPAEFRPYQTSLICIFYLLVTAIW